MNKEQSRKEVIDYLERTSQHIFETEDGKYQTVVKIENNFYSYVDGKLTRIDYEKDVDWYGGNAKNVIKHKIFLYPNALGFGKEGKMKAVRYNKYLRELVNDPVEVLKKELQTVSV